MTQKVAQSDPAEGSREVIERELARHARELTRPAIAKTGMLIRKPVGQVYEAIVNPEITTKFWFSKASGRLDAGRPVKWTWESHDVSIDVTPKVIEPNKRVQIEWPGYSGPTMVEWTFQSVPGGTTFVRVQETGWEGDADKLMKYVADSTQGFTLLMAGMKAWLEHGIQLNLTLDRYPKGIEEQQFE
jgi:uncharacterized protein YndB with AHSA1/START domain